jgi:hypothetical protein
MYREMGKEAGSQQIQNEAVKRRKTNYRKEAVP